MRTDLSQDFIDKLITRGRAPYQILLFKFPGIADENWVYISDTARTCEGNICLPIVESWGGIDDTVDVSKYISNNTASSRQMSISLLNMGASPFSLRFKDTPPENIEVVLYQGFEGLSEIYGVIVDKFLVQDPIAFSQASSLLRLDLVSKNLYANPHMGTLGSNQEFGGVVIGDSSNVPGTPSGIHPEAVLLNDISSTTTEIEVSAAIALFTASGYIIIDNEKIAYTSYSGATFHGCTRGVDTGANYSLAFPHSSNSYVFQQGIEYTWNFASQPIDFMGLVYVDGIVYNGDYTQYPDLDPVQIGFPDGPPWLMTDGNTQIDVYDQYLDNVSGFWYSADTYNCSGYGFSNQQYIGPGYDGHTMYFNGYADATQNVVSGWCDIAADPVNSFLPIWATLNSSSVTVTYRADLPSNDYFYMVLDHDDVQSTNITILPGQGNSSKTWDLSTYGWGMLPYGVKIDVIYKTYRHPGVCANSIGLGIDNAKLSYSYTPKIRDHSTDITCEMSGGVPNNPADTILFVLSKIGVEIDADASSFEIARQWFNTNAYVFDGYIPGEMRTRDALISMLMQCRGRIIYNGGSIKLVVRQHLTDGPIEQVFHPQDIQQKSLSIVRENVDSIYNSITVRYGSDVDIAYSKQVTAEDQPSIDYFGLHEIVLDFFLVLSDTMATDVSAFFLEELKRPHSFIKFKAYMNSFALERDDDIMLFNSFNGMESGAWCKVAYANRIFGSGKNKTINLFEVTAYTDDDSMAAGTVIDLLEYAVVDDSNVETIVGQAKYINLDEVIVVDDAGIVAKYSTISLTEEITVDDGTLDAHANSCTPDGYGSCGYGENPYGD